MWWQSCSRPQAIYVHVPEQPLVQPERARILGGDGTGPGADRIKGNTHRAEVGGPENPRSHRHPFTIVGVKSHITHRPPTTCRSVCRPSRHSHRLDGVRSAANVRGEINEVYPQEI